MQIHVNYRLRTLVLGIASALACLFTLALTALPAKATHEPIDLSISQTDSPDPLETGYLTYALTVKQELVCGGGCNSSGRVEVTDTLPAGVNIVEVNYPATTPSGDGVSCTLGSRVTCTIDDLYDGESVNFDIVVAPAAPGARTLTNTAAVSNLDGHQDPNTTNNSSTATTQVSGSYTPPPDTTPPDTLFTQKPDALSDSASPRIAFTSTEAPSTFECKLDDSAFQSCSSPKQLLLAEGPHTFQVRARDAAGNIDQTPAQHTWTVDSLRPKITFTERPGRATGPDDYDIWVTKDTTPTWAWTITDANLNPGEDNCDFYDETNDRNLVHIEPCSSPYTFDAELPDGEYEFEIETYDKADNYGYAYNYLEVDTVAPKFVSGKPTGKRASTYGTVSVVFDDDVHGSKQFVNIYKKGSNTPLPLGYRDEYGKKIEIDTKTRLKPDTWYTVKVTTGVNDGANNLEAPTTWNFKTKG